MTYATEQHMVDRFGEQALVELTDRVGVGRVDTAVLARALTDADGEINGFLSRFTLPLATVPPDIVRYACDIAYYLLDRRSETARTAYTDALKYLADVRDGKRSLGVDSTQSAPAESGGPQVDGGGRVFTRRTLADY